MNEETLSLAMFWVGVLFAFTPILVAAVVIGTTWYLRKKRKTSAAPSQH
jgi:hypothetical protein